MLLSSLALGLWSASAVGFLINRRGVLLLLLSLELFALATAVQLAVTAATIDAAHGLVVVLFVLASAGCEAALTLALVVAYQRQRGHARV
jgi:NADH-ubiquinone oxidoreductase chain 4L